MAITQERMGAILEVVKEYEEMFSHLEEFAKKITSGEVTQDAGFHLILNFIQDARLSPQALVLLTEERARHKTHFNKNAYARRWREKRKNPLNLSVELGEVGAKDYNPEEDF